MELIVIGMAKPMNSDFQVEVFLPSPISLALPNYLYNGAEKDKQSRRTNIRFLN